MSPLDLLPSRLNIYLHSASVTNKQPSIDLITLKEKTLNLVDSDCVQSGGPDYDVLLGRRDGLVANQSGANSNLPAPSFSIGTIVQMFKDMGLNTTDVVVLSGKKNVPPVQQYSIDRSCDRRWR
jgi:hypothetical protein